jgi:hypothetical protein
MVSKTEPRLSKHSQIALEVGLEHPVSSKANGAGEPGYAVKK